MARSLLAWLETLEAIVKQRQERRNSGEGSFDWFEFERRDRKERMDKIIKKHEARERLEAEQRKRGEEQ
jgi:hypothetical protein